MPEGEPTPLPSTAFPVDDDVHDVNDGCMAEAPVNHHAPAGQRKLTDEDVETIRAMKDSGKPVKEIATLYGVSPKTIYARLIRKETNNQKQNESQNE
jgi:Transposase and inactivated derivatives, IS30 family